MFKIPEGKKQELLNFYFSQLKGRLQVLREFQSRFEEYDRLQREALRLLQILQHLVFPSTIAKQAAHLLREQSSDFSLDLKELVQRFHQVAFPPLKPHKTHSLWLEIGQSLEAISVALDPQRLAELHASTRRVAHALRGSGGTYGFPEISELSARVELSPEPETWSALQELIQHISSMLALREKPALRIMVVDDDPEIQQVLSLNLTESGHEVSLCKGIREAWKLLNNEDIALVILDLILPDGDGRTLLNDIRLSKRFNKIPVLILSAIGFEASTECYALGADLYFEKPVDISALQMAISEKLFQSQRTEQETHHDFLTGLFNRFSMHDHFQRHVLLSVREKQPLSIALLDLDHFKQINDTYGHDAGDEVLRKTAQLLQQTLRQSDIIARWGGEEFVVLMPSTKVTGAAQALQKCLVAMREYPFIPQDQTQLTEISPLLSISFSAGVCEVEIGKSLNETLVVVDQTLYLAKQNGRNQVLIAGDTRVTRPKLQLLLVEDDPLIVSLLQNHFSLHFNLIICNNGQHALEALPEQPIDLVLLDLQLPGLNGFDVLENMRQDPAHAKIPVILLTCQGGEKNLSQAFQLGANDYIQKPFVLADLESRIYRQLNHVKS